MKALRDADVHILHGDGVNVGVERFVDQGERCLGVEGIDGMVEAEVGMWAVIHAGFAIQIMDEEDAQETIRLWNEVLDSDKVTYC